MLLPNATNAYIDNRKLTEYCLNLEHEEGKHKARVFAAALSITSETYFVLKSAILEAILTQDALLLKELSSGRLYQVDFELVYLDKSALVRSGWIILKNEDFPRLTTCFVLT
jgi:hypothetical protein